MLVCFSDPDSRVRYYACESLYNIAKVARAHIVPFFNDIFVGMCKLSADGDPNVKNGASLLDRLVKDIVAESRDFDIVDFIPLLKSRVTQSNPFIRQFLIGWITHMDSVPDIELIEYLPEFLDGWDPAPTHHAMRRQRGCSQEVDLAASLRAGRPRLFNMLSDPNKEIIQQADTALADFRREIQNQPNTDLGAMIPILVPRAQA